MRRSRVALLLGLSCALLACAGPTREPTRYDRARAAFLDDDLPAAAQQAKLALQADPLDARAHFLLACALAEQGQLDQAAVGFQRAWRVDPGRSAAAYNLGTLLLRREEPVAAALWLETALESDPDHVPTVNNLALAYVQAGLPELAVAAYEQALVLDPGNAVARANLERLNAAAAAPRRRDGAPGGPSTPPASAGAAPQDPPAAAGPPAQDAPESSVSAEALQELLREMPHVRAEMRGAVPVLTGWTRDPTERALLDRILLGYPEVLDLTTADVGDSQRMVEVDAILFVVIAVDSQSTGFNFLRLINVNLDYFSTSHDRDGTGFAAPGTIGTVLGDHQSGWMVSASADYDVTIANAVDERVAVLARPHLTTVSGTPASFLAGGEFVFRVSGNISGDIKPYPFGTTLDVTPTLLRTPAADGSPRIHVKVQAGRTSVLDLVLQESTAADGTVLFDKFNVTSEAVLGIDSSLILSGLHQKERRTAHSGVPILRSIPIIKWFFSNTTEVEVDTSVIILLTPRDPAFVDERNRDALDDFLERRRAFVAASKGTEEDFRRFAERYPDWRSLPPNRFASHFFLLQNSELYRAVRGPELRSEDLEFDILGTEGRP